MQRNLLNSVKNTWKHGPGSRMLTALLLFGLLMAFDGKSYGQVTAAGYSFAATSGTYASISGTGTDASTVGTAVSGGILSDDGNQTGIPIGFTFTFCGTNYTTVSMCANGVLSLNGDGAGSVSGSASGISGPGFLMPGWVDLFGGSGAGQTPAAYFQTTGTPGSRVFTAEWNNFSVCCVFPYQLNFQVKLYEGTNQVQFCYGPNSTPWGDVTGIANSTTDFQTLPTSTSTTCNTTYNTGVLMPGDGTILTWSPGCPPGSPLPYAVSMIGGGGYCSGGTGVSVGLAGSAVGINYQLYLGGSPVGSPVAGVGASFSFGLQTAAGVYTATATNSITGCTNTMAGSETVYVYALPNDHNVTGGGDFCTGGSGVTIGLDGSETGISYQLYRGGSPLVGVTVAGTGAAISFPAQTVAGTYTVVAKNTGFTGCTELMLGSATVVVDPLPTAYSVTGTGSYCSGGTGVAVGLSNSDLGINYQLYLGSTAVGSAVAGTGSAISFGSQTTAGAYTVKATDATTGCTAAMTGSATVTITALPAAYTVTGGGGYCSGGTGAPVGLSNSNAGISYQLYNTGVATGTPVTGTGAAISFGPQTATGTYTVVATNTTTSCTNNMTGSVTVTINTLPNVYAMTGGGTFCAGGGGVTVGVAGSDLGVNYQLYRGTTLVGGSVAGTGSAISFGLQGIAGTYTVVGTNPTTHCTSNMSGTSTVVIAALPTAVAVTGGGGYCPGGSGVHVGLANSAIGIDYQLYLGTTAVGSTVAGTGSALDFGLQTSTGTYTATATNSSNGCTANMTGSVNVSVYTVPTTYTVTGGGAFCAGGAGVSVGLSGSALLTNYQLYLGGTAILGAVRSGTGGAISFGAQTSGGTYTVVATGTTYGCTSTMTGSATVTVNPLPVAYSVTGGGSYCSGGTGVTIGTSGSDLGINYQLYRGTVAVTGSYCCVGLPLTFGSQTIAGTYTVVATDATTGCTNHLAGSASVSVNSLPPAFTVTGGGGYCTGGTGVTVGLSGSIATCTYQLYNGTTAVGSPITGAGTALNFGLQTAAGTYTVVSTSTITSCTNTMTGSATVSITALPTAYTVTGGGSYCSGGTAPHVGLSSSSTGVNYQLWRGSTGLGSPFAGTGSALDFGAEAVAGTYSVTATTVGTLCGSSMTGTASVTVNSLPTVYAITGGGSFCSGGTGVSVGLSGSQSGVNYQLYRGTTAVGTAVPGTGSAISFGAQTTAGAYTAVATNATTSCVSNMTGSATVTVISLPTAYTVTGGGSFCTGGAGVAIGLSGSQTGVSYQLYNSTLASGSPVSGTGGAITFGVRTTSGTYVVVATAVSGGCTNNMTGSATITVNSLPTVYSVTGGGSYCTGGTGVSIGLGNSTIGVNYQLLRGTTLVGTAVAGTGSAISFPSQTIAGTYTVVATNTSTSCTSNMSGSATVTINAAPVAVAMTGGGAYCSGGTGVHVGLAGSVGGTTYQLWLGSTAVGSAVSGVGSALDFGLQTSSGTYTATATNTAGCTTTMTGSATVSVNSLPTAYTVTGGGSYCTGSSGLHVGLGGSASGVTYRLFASGTIAGTLSGTGSSLDFGVFTAAGVYTVTATVGSTGCVNNMTGSATVTVNPVPTVSGSMFTLAPGSTTTLTGSISGGSWTSAAPTIATVGGSTGLVTGVAIGTTTITYTLTTGCWGSHLFYVTPSGRRDNPSGVTATTESNIGSISVVPNPNHGAFTVKGSMGASNDQELYIQVTNMLGQVVYTNKAIVNNGEINEPVQLTGNIANGMYLLSLHSGSETKVVHIVIEQ